LPFLIGAALTSDDDDDSFFISQNVPFRVSDGPNNKGRRIILLSYED
jgi:hypothetical protein